MWFGVIGSERSARFVDFSHGLDSQLSFPLLFLLVFGYSLYPLLLLTFTA
jgi:hypothetical protein